MSGLSWGIAIAVAAIVGFLFFHFYRGIRMTKIIVAVLAAVFVFAGIVIPWSIRGTYWGAGNIDRARVEARATYAASNPEPIVSREDWQNAGNTITGLLSGGGGSGMGSAEGGTTWDYQPQAGETIPVAPPTATVEWFLKTNALEIMTARWSLLPGSRPEEPILIGVDNIPDDVRINLVLSNGRGNSNANERWAMTLTYIPTGQTLPLVVNGWFAREGFGAAVGGTQLVGTGKWDQDVVCGKDCFYAVEIPVPTPAATPPPAQVVYPFTFPRVVRILPQGEKPLCGCQSEYFYIECTADGFPDWGNETSVMPGETCRAP